MTFLAFCYNSSAEEAENFNGLLSISNTETAKRLQRLHLTVSSLLPPSQFWDTFDSLEELQLIFTSKRKHKSCAYFYEDTIFSSKIRGIDDNKLPKLKKFTTADITGKLFVSSYTLQERKSFPDVSINRNLDRAFLSRWANKRVGGLMSDANGNALMGPNTVILYRLPESIKVWPGLQHLGLCLREDSSPRLLYKILCNCSSTLKSLVILITNECLKLQACLAVIINNSLLGLQQLCILKKAGVKWKVDMDHLLFPKLTHLSLPHTAIHVPTDIEPPYASSSSSYSDRNGSKKSRLGTADCEQSEYLPFYRSMSKCSKIEVLEIGMTEEDEMKYSERKEDFKPPLNSRIAVESLFCIKNLSCLTHLTLQNLPLRKGDLLLSIIKNCRKLMSLRIKDLGQSGLCCYTKQLSEAFQFCTSLKDLRIEQNSLAPCKDLLQALISYGQLQRLVLISPTPSHTFYDTKDVIELIKSNTSLVFGVFLTSNITSKDEQCVRRAVKKMQKPRPELVVVTTVPVGETNSTVVPLIHSKEMLELSSWARHHNIVNLR